MHVSLLIFNFTIFSFEIESLIQIIVNLQKLNYSISHTVITAEDFHFLKMESAFVRRMRFHYLDH